MTTKTFILYRDQDITGISGTGPVADGVAFPDGTVVEALHGHNGATRIVWGSSTAVCKHCGRGIAAAREPAGWVHVDGGQRGLNRCHTDDSDMPYGYDAAPEGAECGRGCLGGA